MMGFLSFFKGKPVAPTPAAPTPAAGPYRQDGWQNPYTGLGTTRDKVYAGTFWAPVRLGDQELLALYNGSPLARRICETRPREMLRKGYEISVAGQKQDASKDQVSELVKQADKLELNSKLKEAGIWGNVFGGALLFIGAEDGLDVKEPLNEENIRSIRFLNVIDKRFVYVASYYTDPLSPKFGKPQHYMVTNNIGAGIQLIHESRVIRFEGLPVDIITAQSLAGWTWSLLQILYEHLRVFETSFQAVGNLVMDASQAVFKIDGLIDMVAAGEKEKLQTRMQLVEMSRSVCRAVLIDAEKEDFERKATSFAGLPEVIDRIMMLISGDTRIPVTILMGRSPAGMNATGDSDFQGFYDDIASEQENELSPKLKRLFHILALAKDSPFKGESVEFNIKHNPLWQLTAKEQAELEKTTADKDVAYINAGVISPEEVALSRWGTGRFSTETKVDVKALQRSLDIEKSFSQLKPPGQPPGQIPGQQSPNGQQLPPEDEEEPKPPNGAQ